MLLQRVRESCESGEKQIIKWAAEGAVKGFVPSILQREGMRQLPGI